MERLPEKVLRLIQARDVAQAQVARAIGVDPSQFAKWLKGAGRPTAEQLLRLARHLDVSMEYLADDAMGVDAPDPRSSLTEDQRFALELIDALGLNKREVARRLAVARPESVPADEGDRGQARLVQG